jgi:hypothetical protein
MWPVSQWSFLGLFIIVFSCLRWRIKSNDFVEYLSLSLSISLVASTRIV